MQQQNRKQNLKTHKIKARSRKCYRRDRKANTFKISQFLLWLSKKKKKKIRSASPRMCGGTTLQKNFSFNGSRWNWTPLFRKCALVSDVLAAQPQLQVIYRVYRSCQSRVRKTQCLYLKVMLKLDPLAELRERAYLFPLAEPLPSIAIEKIQGAWR